MNIGIGFVKAFSGIGIGIAVKKVVLLKAPSRSQFSTGHYACNNTRSVKVEKPQTNFIVDVLAPVLVSCSCRISLPSFPHLGTSLPSFFHLGNVGISRQNMELTAELIFCGS